MNYHNSEKKNRKYSNKKQNSDKKMGVAEHQYVLDQINMWINNADSKVSTFCGVFALVYGSIAFVAENIIIRQIEKAETVNRYLKNIALILFCLGGLAFLLSVFFCFKAIGPKLTGEKNKKELKETKEKYSIFYGRISQIGEKEDFIKQASSATKECFLNNIIDEIYINAGICTRKMKYFKTAIWISFTAIIIEIACAIILYLAYL